MQVLYKTKGTLSRPGQRHEPRVTLHTKVRQTRCCSLSLRWVNEYSGREPAVYAVRSME